MLVVVLDVLSRCTLRVGALRHQLLVLQRSVVRPRRSRWDRVFWIWLSRGWASWRSSHVIVQPATVLAWHRRGFQLYWRRDPSAKPIGRPRLDPELRRSDPAADGARESDLGPSAHSGRIRLAGLRGRRAGRCQSACARSSTPSLADVGHLSRQPPPRSGGHRLFSGLNAHVPAPLRLRRPPTRSPRDPPSQRHRSPHRGLDPPPTDPGFPEDMAPAVAYSVLTRIYDAVATGGCHDAFEFEWFVSQAVQTLSPAGLKGTYDRAFSKNSTLSHAPHPRLSRRRIRGLASAALQVGSFGLGYGRASAPPWTGPPGQPRQTTKTLG